MKNNKDERVGFRLTSKELEIIDARVNAAKERGEKCNRSKVAREALQQLLAA